MPRRDLWTASGFAQPDLDTAAGGLLDQRRGGRCRWSSNDEGAYRDPPAVDLDTRGSLRSLRTRSTTFARWSSSDRAKRGRVSRPHPKISIRPQAAYSINERAAAAYSINERVAAAYSINGEVAAPQETGRDHRGELGDQLLLVAVPLHQRRTRDQQQCGERRVRCDRATGRREAARTCGPSTSAGSRAVRRFG